MSLKKLTQLGVITFFLPFLFLFQNCQKNKLLEPWAHASTEKISLENLGVEKLSLPSASAFNDSSELMIDIYQSTIKDSEGHKYCPGYNFFYSIQDILNESQLCDEALAQDDTSTLCSTAEASPSVTLITDKGEEIHLNSGHNNCHAQNLCSPHKEDFELLIKKFMEIKDTFLCNG